MTNAKLRHALKEYASKTKQKPTETKQTVCFCVTLHNSKQLIIRYVQYPRHLDVAVRKVPIQGLGRQVLKL